MPYFTDFNTKILKQCLVSKRANAPSQKFEIKKSEKSCIIGVHIFSYFIELWKTQNCFFLNLLYSHSVWVFSVFPIRPSGIGNYCKWSIKRRGAYFIFHVKVAALIRERRLFQLQVKHKGEYRENYELGKKNYYHTSNCYMNQVSKVSVH